MTLDERLNLAREIAAQTKTRFVVDNSRQKSFEEAKRRTQTLAKKG